VRYLASLAALTMLATLGCASEQFPMAPLQLPDAVPLEPLSGGEGRQIALAIPFSDERADRERCGNNKSSHTGNWRGFRCEGEDLGFWIAMQLAGQLSAAGFEVVTDGSTTSPRSLRIEGTLQRLFVEPVVGLWSISIECDLQLSLVASTAGGLKAERTFFAKRRFPWFTRTFTATFQRGIEQCGRSMIVEVVTAIADLANRYDPIASRRLDAPGPVVRTRRSDRWVSLAGISSPAE